MDEIDAESKMEEDSQESLGQFTEIFVLTNRKSALCPTYKLGKCWCKIFPASGTLRLELSSDPNSSVNLSALFQV